MDSETRCMASSKVNKQRKAFEAMIRNAKPDSKIYPRSSSRSRAMVGKSYSWQKGVR